MAWYYGTYSCGHEGRTNVTGPIEDRQEKADWHFSGLCLECYKKHMHSVIDKDAINENRDEEDFLTVSSECEDKKPGIVKIEYDDSIISARYIKNDEFIEIVKGLWYKWNGVVWVKKITEYNETWNDRAAELGNKLLASGFTVQFPSEAAKNMAVSGEFSAENDRWVKYNIRTGQLALVWIKRSDILYYNAKRLPGARWKDGSMRVNIEFYKEVEDFADTMGFSISKTAQEEIKRYKSKESRFETVSAKPPSAEQISDEEKIARALRFGGTIIEDLMDE